VQWLFTLSNEQKTAVLGMAVIGKKEMGILTSSMVDRHRVDDRDRPQLHPNVYDIHHRLI
jgi:hypothetical protein